MDRIERMREGLAKDALGLEIGPWFNPIVPKREGYNVLVADYLGAAELRQRAMQDPAIPDSEVDKIEEVDFVGSVTDILKHTEDKGITGAFDYILSSHNIEHLPDPVSFLQNAERILKPGGLLAMAIPDKRCCFDHFRPHSTTADLLEAYVQKRTRPSFSQIFEYNAYHAYNHSNNVTKTAWSVTDNPKDVRVVNGGLLACYELACSSEDDLSKYIDAHCWAFTPTSLQLIMMELSDLGLIHLDLDDIYVPGGGEFFVRLRVRDNLTGSTPLDATARSELLFQIADENAQVTRRTHGWLPESSPSPVGR